ncbi:uncharacterized protein EKO05_0000157 [Ascochyta rabiei]|uniref:Uncharacterized protein n=1 Tax=Didymella rabiei TaxID=5454 RepID=A0A163CA35_DIDRA|nr:uncharacterized protein EKO05_0000157 [Ascochyta rabiei]KZM22314.1 hypothetical protein ST47_g6571 [Ascochyta rabiei]UPX09468.1 hypothetical protein EKO05_0000157 [Ascochyta rabiei]
MSLPILFTIPPSNRHEFLVLDGTSKPTLKALNKQVTSTLASSPNCAEFMGKYKASGGASQEVIQEFRVHWSSKEYDYKVWPEFTVVTEENLGAVLELLQREPKSGVLEIKVGKAE